jgi:hypothetical protein
MTNEKVKITITDDNHRVFDINKIPVSIDAIIEHLAFTGRWVGAVPNSEFNLEEHLKTNDYPLVGWSSADFQVLLKAYIDKRGVKTIEYNINVPESVQRFAIVCGMLICEHHYINDKAPTMWLFDPRSDEGCYGTFTFFVTLLKKEAASLLLPVSKVKEFLASINATNDTDGDLILSAVSEHFNTPIEATKLIIDKTEGGIIISSFPLDKPVVVKAPTIDDIYNKKPAVCEIYNG